ncbi:hypothetical protein ACS0TY_023200 [Phlomoides rotata]
MMINTERNGNGMAVGGTAAPAHDKQLLGSKKTALRDVQNENVGSILKQSESLLPGGGKSCGDTVKVCGNKRLTPERPSSSQGLLFLGYNGTNENVMNARKRIELELGKGRFQNSVEKITEPLESKNVGQVKPDIAQKQKRDGNLHQGPVATPNNLTAIMAFTSSSPSVPTSFGKQSHNSPVAKVSPAPPRTVDSKSTNDLLRIETERYIRLQNFLKKCDEADHREYSQILMHLSPSELSKHAVVLEKRSMQLTYDEGKEMLRMKELNILIKPSLGNNLVQSTQLLQTNKR